MSVFPDWQKYAVPQRQEKTGCIPTGYEILLRAAHVPGIDFSTFQEEFDLEHQGTGKNHFITVAEAIQKRYPFVKVRQVPCDAGTEKLRFIEEQLAKQRPILISLWKGKGQGYHIMPVVDADGDHLVLLNKLHDDGRPELIRILKADLVDVHDATDGGKEVAFLDED